MPAVAVLGDLHCEVLGHLDAPFREVTADLLRPAPLRLAVGGTAGNFALAATRHFDQVHLIGRVGDDVPGRIVAGLLGDRGVRHHLDVDPHRPTGLAIALRDAGGSPSAGVRLLLVGEGSANLGLTPAQVHRHAALLSRVDLLLVDGYGMLDDRRAALLAAMSLTAGSGGLVAFDVVPHDCHHRYDLATLGSLIRHAHLVIAEVRTLCRFAGLDFDERAGREAAIDRAHLLRPAFPGRSLLLRFGLGNADESLFVPVDGPIRHRHTGYRGTTRPTGFGDRLAARELAEYLPALTAAHGARGAAARRSA